MKNKKKKEKNKLLRKNFTNFFLKISAWTILFPTVLMGILNFILNRLDFQWLYDYSPKIYYKIVRLSQYILNFDTLTIIVGLLWLVGVIFIIYQLIKKYNFYINEVYNASQNLLNREIEYIELPPELEDLQIKLNHLKRESEKNERLARESEQRKNDLIVYLAHDLKTPLTSMIGYLSLLDEIKDMPPKQKEKYISIALDKSYRLEELINELFDIARFNSETIVLEKENINLTLMLEQIIDDFYPLLIEKNKEIKLNYKEKIQIDGDPDKLARVFGNIIKNAIHYSTEQEITIDIEKKENSVNIITSNKGKKIPEEKLEKLFEKFYRADTSRTSKTGGSGLGLAIAKEIVELHGGSIKATSDDRDTKFIVTLPLSERK